jgi:hypothetical protein
MMAIRKSSFGFILILGLISQPLFSQEEPLKAFAEQYKDKAYCFYPSTLRMINLAQDENFNEMINDINKLLIFTLKKTGDETSSFMEVIDDYKEEGFEEYASIWGGMTMHIYGKSGRDNKIVGLFDLEDQRVAFYLDGSIAWQKIPTLMNSLQDQNLLNFFEIIPHEWND